MTNMKMWTCKDGRKVRVKDMDDKHLENTIKFLRRQHQEIVFGTSYPSFNGEMAQYYAEQEFDRLCESRPEDFWPIYEDMMQEADKRHLAV